MESGKYYVLAKGKNLEEAMSKEQTLAAIVQAVETHAISDVDTGFVTKLKERNKNKPFMVWIGTTAEYNAIVTKEENCLYIPTDDVEFADLLASIADLNADVTEIGETVNEHTSALQTLSGTVESQGIYINNRIAISAAPIIDQEVEYGSSLDYENESDLPLTSYKLVTVTAGTAGDILCNVQIDSANNRAYIKGVGNAMTGNTAGITLIRIAIIFNTSTDKLIQNTSTAVVMTSGGTTIAGQKITRIMGVY